ncbi:Lcl C-terminal domain-containing protein [Campylobacter rectus]
MIRQDGADTFRVNYDEAKHYCENLNFAGYSDWRLPTRLELLSITDDSRFDPAINRAFKDFVSRFYWSSTKSAGFSSAACFVDFRYGWDDCVGVSIRRFVRCVRDY